MCTMWASGGRPAVPERTDGSAGVMATGTQLEARPESTAGQGSRRRAGGKRKQMEAGSRVSGGC